MSLFNTIIIAIAIVAFSSATDAIDSADVGLNENLILADSVITSSVCNKGFVDCRNGDEVIDGETTTRTCHEACEESCCSGGRGGDACDNFSGLVCKDGSCNASNGGNVCKDASIKRVINSCIGAAACRNAGSNGGSVGDVVDSCQGDMACSNAGSDGGIIGIIQNSCRDGDHNCVAAGAKGGMIGIIKNSCRDGNRNCVTAGGDGGIIGSINDSCQFGDRNCLGLAEEGSIGYITGSCSGTEDVLTHDSCYKAGFGGSIRTIKNSCRGLGACGYAADGGSIDSIDNSCNYGEYNCAGVAGYEGSIGHILSSCSGTAADPVNYACAGVGYGDDIGDILSCCNGEDEVCCHSSYFCIVTVTTLPDDCAPDLTVGIRGFARHFADE